jgi:DNA-binding LacI/PurR family transcriptional regulator
LSEFLHSHRPDGLIFKDDSQAALASRFLHEDGHRIGEDLALAGFGNWPLAALLSVPLTSIRQPVEAIARNAVLMMLDRIKDPGQPGRHVTLGCELVVRESTSQYGG